MTFDSDRAHKLRIRQELLHLARHWDGTASASAEMKQAAKLLEARCVAWLAGHALGDGQISEFTDYLLKVQDRWTLAPGLAVVRSAIDREFQRRNAPEQPGRT